MKEIYSNPVSYTHLDVYKRQAQDRAVNIFPFMGATGDNYTGCEVTGFSLAGNNLITVGKSVPHGFAVNGQTGYENLNKNIFMIDVYKRQGLLSSAMVLTLP